MSFFLVFLVIYSLAADPTMTTVLMLALAVPMVLKCCAEFIEQYGVVDGIYRLSGITSNIQKLR